MLSPLVCLNVGPFGIIKIPLSCSEQKKVRSYRIDELKEKHPFFEILQIFTITKEGWLEFNKNIDVVNIFNKDIDSIFIVLFVSYNASSITSFKDFKFVEADNEDFTIARYISSYIFLQNCNILGAFEILENIDDYLLSRLVINAYSFDDKQFALDQLRFAIQSKDGRYIEGRKKYIYDPTKLDCVFEILKYLMGDPEAVFYPLHPKGYFDSEFVKDKNKEFICDNDIAIPFNKLRWDAEKVDLSASINIQGYVELTSVENNGLPRRIETFTLRTFYFIRNGISENAKVYFNASIGTLVFLKSHGLIEEDMGKWYIDLSSLPLLSRKLARSNITGPDLHKIIMELIEAKKRYYSLVYIKNKLFPNNTKDPYNILYKSFSEEQRDILKTKYRITEDGYNFINSPVKRGLTNINFYVSHNAGEIDIIKLAYIAKEPLTSKVFSPEDLQSSYVYLDLFSFHFFDYLEKNQSKTIDYEIDICLKQIVELEYIIQHFRMVCITSSWWSDLVRTGVCGYKCEQGDLVFTEASLYD